MDYIPRALEPELCRQLSRRKSVLLLGPRQTGKTTLLARFAADLRVELLLPEVEYREATRGFLVCRAPRRTKLSERVTALPWQEIPALLA